MCFLIDDVIHIYSRRLSHLSTRSQTRALRRKLLPVVKHPLGVIWMRTIIIRGAFRTSTRHIMLMESDSYTFELARTIVCTKFAPLKRAPGTSFFPPESSNFSGDEGRATHFIYLRCTYCQLLLLIWGPKWMLKLWKVFNYFNRGKYGDRAKLIRGRFSSCE